MPRFQAPMIASHPEGGRHGDTEDLRRCATGEVVELPLMPEPGKPLRPQLESKSARVTPARPILAPWQIKLATTAMTSDISSAISVAEIAFRCRLSPGHFVRAYSYTTGVTPYAWFMRQRIGHAMNLLAGSNLPLAQVALECGFSDQAHFTKSFVKVTGVTPAKWRRSMTLMFEHIVAGAAET